MSLLKVDTLTFIRTPEPGFEPGSKAPQAFRISKLPHSDTRQCLKT